ncbi:MAG: hypothetical protein AAF657_30790 [Acidobacteriota bacterium]
MSVRAGLLRAILALSMSAMAASAGLAQAPAPVTRSEMLDFFGFDSEAVTRMRGGEILRVDMPALEGTDTGLGVAFGMIIPHGVGDCSEQFSGPEMFQIDPNTLAHGRIDPENPRGALGKVGLDRAEIDEATAFLRSARGDDFNLSASEYARVGTHAAAGGSSLDAANAAYRELLLGRFESYRQAGLSGIEDYARKGRKVSQPALELRAALANSPILESRLPSFHRHLGRYPQGPLAGVQERFYWVKRRVEERPVFSLIHWSLLVRPEFAFLAERTFYASHTYNAQQVYFGVMPFEQGVMVFYLNRTFTDKVDVFAKSVAHKIGRGKVAEPIRLIFETLRERIAG